MKFSTENNMRPCGCKSVAECNCYHNAFAEDNALRGCVDQFAKELLHKLQKKKSEGYTGWDDPNWTVSHIMQALKEHIEKGDPIDIAAFAMFAWNRESR